MHKWKLFKKSAALVLSSAVIASGVPVTAMAAEAEAFSDVSKETQEETVQEEDFWENQEEISEDQQDFAEDSVQLEDSEDSSAEDIQEEDTELSAKEVQPEEIQAEDMQQEDTEDTFNDGDAFMSEAGEVLQDASEITVAGVKYLWSMQPVKGYTQIGTTGVYVKVADGQTALTGKLYGTATLSYSEFYAGDTTQENYDAITSATTSKNQIFANEDSTAVTSSGYQIQGVKNVSVAVDAETYVDALALKAADKLPREGVYTEAADITLNEAPTQNAGQYKILNADGTYSATKFNVKATVTDASAEIQAPSIWGDYMLVVKEASTNYLRNSRQDDFAVGGNTLGAIVETASGKKVGLRHTYEIWVQPYELAFSADSGLMGEKISKVTYITPDGAYVYKFAKGIYIKPQAAEAMAVSPEFTDSTHIRFANLDKYKNPKVSVFYTTGIGHASKSTYLAQDAAAVNGVVTLDPSVERPENETYTVKISSDDYADVSVQLVYGTIAFKEKSGTLYIGGSKQLEVSGENCKDVTYVSGNTKVAAVDANGKVTAKAAGIAVITATSAAGKTAEYKLTVKTPSVKLNVSSKTLYVKGSPATVALKVTKTGLTGKVTYTSSNKAIAAVSKTGKITAKKAGTATITVKCGSYKATCKITVKKPSVKAAASVKTVFVGGTSQIKVTKAGVSGKVTYTSSNKAIAAVSKTGKITAKKAGTATITVKCGSYKATCKITVKKGSLKLTSKTAVSVKAKKTTAIKATATSKAKITYTSSNKKVATVSSKGVVKGVKKGKAVIYVSSNGITKKVTVTVK